MFGPIRFIVFDLDGTLVDTMTHVIDSIVYAAKTVRGDEISREEVVREFVPSTEVILAKWFVSDEEKVRAVQAWKSYQPDGFSWAQVFPGVEELLAALHSSGIQLALFTGRGRESALGILKEHGWLDKYFTEETIVCGDDGFGAKPSGEGIVHLLKAFDGEKKEVLVVGDHLHDLEAGRDAGIRTAAAMWDTSMAVGLNDRAKFKNQWSEMSEDLCDLRLSDPAGLLAWSNQ